MHMCYKNEDARDEISSCTFSSLREKFAVQSSFAYFIDEFLLFVFSVFTTPATCPKNQDCTTATTQCKRMHDID